jgi:hypothetical protein
MKKILELFKNLTVSKARSSVLGGIMIDAKKLKLIVIFLITK